MQGTHLAIPPHFQGLQSIAGPIRPAITRDHYLVLSGQPDIYCWPNKANNYNLIEYNYHNFTKIFRKSTPWYLGYCQVLPQMWQKFTIDYHMWGKLTIEHSFHVLPDESVSTKMVPLLPYVAEIYNWFDRLLIAWWLHLTLINCLVKCFFNLFHIKTYEFNNSFIFILINWIKHLE